jgi:hypothetical protein
MNAPLHQPSVIKDSLIPVASVVSKNETAAAVAPAVVYIDLDFLDGNKTISGMPYRLSTQAWR